MIVCIYVPGEGTFKNPLGAFEVFRLLALLTMLKDSYIIIYILWNYSGLIITINDNPEVGGDNMPSKSSR